MQINEDKKDYFSSSLLNSITKYSFSQSEPILITIIEDHISISFMVRHHESAHVTPVYIEKKDNHYNFFISDSLGQQSLEQEEFKPRFTTEMIKNIIHLMRNDNYTIYASKKQRQKDHTNCTVFSLIDTKKIFNEKLFFNALKERSKPENFVLQAGVSSDCIVIHWVENLPFKFEIANQSLKEITECMKRIESSNHENIYKKNKFEKIENKYIWYIIKSNSTDYREKIAQNSYVIKKRNILIKMIIDKALTK